MHIMIAECAHTGVQHDWSLAQGILELDRNLDKPSSHRWEFHHRLLVHHTRCNQVHLPQDLQHQMHRNSTGSPGK